MRRGMSVTALAVAVALGATACGSSGGTSNSSTDGRAPAGSSASPASVSGTITWWDTSDPKAEAPAYQALIKKFEAKYPKIKVNYVNVPYGQAENKFKTAAQSGNGAPDVFRSDIGWLPSLAALGYLQKLDGTQAVSDPSDFLSGPASSATYDGVRYGVPEVTDTLALMYDKKLFAKAGITTAPTTWKQYQQDALTVKRKTGATGTYVNPDSYYAWPFLYGEGSDMINVKQKKILINSPASVKGIQTARNLVTSGAAPKPDLTNGYNTMLADFGAGTMGEIICGPWCVSIIDSGKAFKNDPGNLAITTVPAGSAGKPGAPTGGHALTVYAGSKHLDADYLFVKFMNSATSQEYVAEHNATLPARKSAYTPAVLKNPTVKAFQPILDHAQPRPASPAAGDLFTDYTPIYGKILTGQVSVKSGLDQLAKTWKQKYLKDYAD